MFNQNSQLEEQRNNMLSLQNPNALSLRGIGNSGSLQGYLGNAYNSFNNLQRMGIFAPNPISNKNGTYSLNPNTSRQMNFYKNLQNILNGTFRQQYYQPDANATISQYYQPSQNLQPTNLQDLVSMIFSMVGRYY